MEEMLAIITEVAIIKEDKILMAPDIILMAISEMLIEQEGKEVVVGITIAPTTSHSVSYMAGLAVWYCVTIDLIKVFKACN